VGKGGPIQRRLVSLERKLKPKPDTECPECGGPIPGQNMYAVLNKAGKPFWGVCGSCGLALDNHGRACCPHRLGPGEQRSRPKLYGPAMAGLIERM
jgi:hypothetical protein